MHLVVKLLTGEVLGLRLAQVIVSAALRVQVAPRAAVVPRSRARALHLVPRVTAQRLVPAALHSRALVLSLASVAPRGQAPVIAPVIVLARQSQVSRSYLSFEHLKNVWFLISHISAFWDGINQLFALEPEF